MGHLNVVINTKRDSTDHILAEERLVDVEVELDLIVHQRA